MMLNVVTCKDATTYPEMLTRGKEYKIVEIDSNKGVIKLVCDNGRTRKFPLHYFDLEGKPIPMLVRWEFDDTPEESKSEEFISWVEVTFELNTGEKRWCKLFTPELLRKVLNQSGEIIPGFFLDKYIAVRSLEYDDVDKVLRYLDESNELISASLPI